MFERDLDLDLDFDFDLDAVDDDDDVEIDSAAADDDAGDGDADRDDHGDIDILELLHNDFNNGGEQIAPVPSFTSTLFIANFRFSGIH